MKTTNMMSITIISIFYLIGFAILGCAIKNLYSSTKARNWPTTEGIIDSCQLIDTSDSDGSSYRVNVEYHYTVNGLSYTGQRLAYGYGGTSGETAHQAILEKLTRAKNVLVRYDPNNPSNACLAYGVNHSIVMMFIFSAIWLTFMLGASVSMSVCSGYDRNIMDTLITNI